MQQRKAVLIISGYNHRGIIAFCRFFTNYHVPFYIVSSGTEDMIHDTAYQSNIIHIRKEKTLTSDHFSTFKNDILQQGAYDKIIILPSTEYLNRFLLQERQYLENIGYEIPLVSQNLYAEISDKYSFGELCKSNGIRVPNEYETVTIDQIPFVAKPKSYFTQNNSVNEKPIIVKNRIDFEALQKSVNNTSFYFQEFVGGKSFYLLYYFNKNGGYQVFSQQNLIQQDNGLSIIAAQSSSFHTHEVADAFAHIFLQKKYTGLLMIEVKEYQGEVYMIEANPRIWGPSQLVIDAGMNLFYHFAFDYGLIDRDTILPEYKTDVRYFWSAGIVEDRKKGNTIAFHQYDASLFFDEYHRWISSDIYLREDTIKLFN